MASARHEVIPHAAADRFTHVLEAEAQAREAIRACQQAHEQAINQAQAQATRIHARANSRIKRIQAAQDAYVKALAQPLGRPDQPAATADDIQQEDERLHAAVDRLAAQLTGEPE
jgi:hypothetical protein